MFISSFVFKFQQFTSIKKVIVDIVEGTQMCSNTGSVTQVFITLHQNVIWFFFI